MLTKTASTIHSEVETLLGKGEVGNAFELLSDSVDRQTDAKLKDIFKHQEETYKYLLHYLVEGFSDSSRNNILSDIISDLYFINDSIIRNEILKDSPELYYSTLRFQRIRKNSLKNLINEFKDEGLIEALQSEDEKDIASLQRHDQALSSLFSYVWTMFGSPADDYKLLEDFIKEDSSFNTTKELIISALLLGNLSYYDRKALSALINIYESDISEHLTARALVAIILIIAAHTEKIRSDASITSRLRLWEDNISIYRQLREAMMTIVRAQDTQRISSKMQNEVLPELLKLRPEILRRFGNISEGLSMESLEQNPEWEELLSKNGLGDKLKELTEMQIDGGDVMMFPFSNLKSFPFFNNISNWFLPFFEQNYYVQKAASGMISHVSQFLHSAEMMCDSDKYSFVFSLASMPESQRQLVIPQMKEQLAQMKEMMSDKRVTSSIPNFDRISTLYVRDLYRFFKLFRKKEEFKDPFKSPIDFLSLPVIGDLFLEDEMNNLLGEFYFKRGYYNEALPLLLQRSQSHPDDALILEKIGFCYNNLKEIDKALDYYRKAEFFNPESFWLIKKIALCLRMLNMSKEAAEYYKKALEVEPDNFNLLVNTANALLDSGNLEEALLHFYHAVYINPESIISLRGVAWTELLNKNFEKSLKYYEKIISHPKSTATDYLNMAHVFFLIGDYKSAVNTYLKSARFKDFGMDNLKKAVSEDLPVINSAGGDSTILMLLLDKVKYDLK